MNRPSLHQTFLALLLVVLAPALSVTSIRAQQPPEREVLELDGRKVTVLRGFTDGVDALDVAPGGGVVAVADGDMALRVLDATSGQQRAVVRTFAGELCYAPAVEGATANGLVAFVPSNQRDDVLVLDPARPTDGWRLAGAAAGLMDLCWVSPTEIAGAYADGSIAVHAIDRSAAEGDRAGVLRRRFAAHDKAVTTLTVDSEGQLWSGGVDGMIRAFARDVLIDGKADADPPEPESTIEAGEQVQRIVWSAAAGRLFALIGKQSLRAYRPGRSRPTLKHDNPAEIVTFDVSPDGKRVAVADVGNVVRLLESKRGRERERLTGHDGLVMEVRFHPTAPRLFTGSMDGTVRIWELGKRR